MSTSTENYFLPLEANRYLPTEYAGGAWREDELHLAPVTGLIVHQLERWREENADPSFAYSRITLEILGQIMREPIELEIEVVRPGRRIMLLECKAIILGRVTIRAHAWLLSHSDTSDFATHNFELLPHPDECSTPAEPFPFTGKFLGTVHMLDAGENRPGRGRKWLTTDYSLIAGVESTSLANFTTLLDMANGISAPTTSPGWSFPNVDLSLHFFRQPRGRWAGIDKRGAFGADGYGLTSSVMHDVNGPVGTISQSVILQRNLPV